MTAKIISVAAIRGGTHTHATIRCGTPGSGASLGKLVVTTSDIECAYVAIESAIASAVAAAIVDIADRSGLGAISTLDPAALGEIHSVARAAGIADMIEQLHITVDGEPYGVAEPDEVV